MSFLFGRSGHSPYYIDQYNSSCYPLTYYLSMHLRTNFRVFDLAAFISAAYHCEDGFKVTVRFLRGACFSKLDDRVLSYRAASSVTLLIFIELFRSDFFISVIKLCLSTDLKYFDMNFP